MPRERIHTLSTIELITIKELLRDPQYRAYFSKVPKLPAHVKPESLPWKLIIQKPDESIWRSKRYGTYPEAFAGLKKMLPKISNAAINCPGLGFMPPVRTVRLKGKFDKKGAQVIRTTLWTPQISSDMAAHNWCPHCRRPSIFRIARLSRPARGEYSTPQGEPVLRCIICGASERVVDLRHPENTQGWDVKRPRLTKVN